MRVLPIILALSLPGMALAQTTPFKVFPQNACALFDQTCTSFTSRCSLGAPGGEVLQEYPMNSLDANGNSTDLFRGIGEAGFPDVGVCTVVGMFYITQDQNCIDQEDYDLIMRGVDPSTLSGPDTNDAAAPIPPGAISLQTPAGGPPSPCAWGITVTFGTPVTVPCSSSLFIGVKLANNAAWVANGQSQQGTWQNLIPGDPCSPTAPQTSWQIAPGSIKGQCGTLRNWDMGVLVNCATLNLGNITTSGSCPTITPAACGEGGQYPDISGLGDGLSLCVKDWTQPGAGIFSFMSFSASPIPIPLVGILDKSLWIGPSPFIQITFGTNVLDATGCGDDTAAFLAPGALTPFVGGRLWFQSLLFGANPLPLNATNAASTYLN